MHAAGVVPMQMGHDHMGNVRDLIAERLNLSVDTLFRAQRDADLVGKLAIGGVGVADRSGSDAGVDEDQSTPMLDEKTGAREHDRTALAENEGASLLGDVAAFESPELSGSFAMVLHDFPPPVFFFPGS